MTRRDELGVPTPTAEEGAAEGAAVEEAAAFGSR